MPWGLGGLACQPRIFVRVNIHRGMPLYGSSDNLRVGYNDGKIDPAEAWQVESVIKQANLARAFEALYYHRCLLKPL